MVGYWFIGGIFRCSVQSQNFKGLQIIISSELINVILDKDIIQL